MKLTPLNLTLVMVLSPALGANPPIRFRDATASSGIQFVHTDGSAGERHIVETIASGLGLIDYNGDGLLDLYFLNGAPLGGGTNRAPGNALYRNNGDDTFTDVTQPSQAAVPGYSVGCAVADYDNDGDEDIFITNYGPHRLLRNNGDETFTDATEKAGLANASLGVNCVGAGCAFLDYDRDGHLDLYVGNYLECDRKTPQPCARAGVPVYCDPRAHTPLPDRLYQNRGDGTFRDVSESSGIGRYRNYTMGLVCSDFDGDGWTDIYVGNDVRENFLFRNRKDGTFEECGVLAGVAYDMFGDQQGTMGANAADFDGDGRADILVTSYQNQVNTLYRNMGNIHGGSHFQDVTLATGIGAGSLPLVTWGWGFGDFDNDGAREVFIAAGHLQDTIERFDHSSSYRQRNQLFQLKSGRFLDITAGSGEALQVVESSRGTVLGDLNNDGRMDIVVLNARSRPTVMINQTQTQCHWAILKLVGTRNNRSAVGAAARLTVAGRTQVDEVRAGRGYQSAEDLRLHFGLGAHPTIDTLAVTWPSGLVETWTNLTANRVIRLTEGEPASASR